jgi:hypothetical protein
LNDDETEAESQPTLFCEFSLEDHAPQDHLLRLIDRFTDLSRILLIGYGFCIRSERSLCGKVLTANHRLS